MNARSVRISRMITAVALALVAAGCAASAEGTPADGDGTIAGQESELAISKEPVAPDDTRVKAVGGNYAEKARTNESCLWGGPCGCYLDGIRTSCSLVAACLRSHNCVLVNYVGG